MKKVLADNKKQTKRRRKDKRRTERRRRKDEKKSGRRAEDERTKERRTERRKEEREDDEVFAFDLPLPGFDLETHGYTVKESDLELIAYLYEKSIWSGIKKKRFFIPYWRFRLWLHKKMGTRVPFPYNFP